MSPSRLDRLRHKLGEKELDALFISDPLNRRYLSGFTGSAGFLLIAPEEAMLATDFRYFEQSQLEAPAFRLFKEEGKPAEWLPQLLAPARGLRLGFESRNLSYAQHRELGEAAQGLDGLQLVPTLDLVEELRAVKEEEELEHLRQAAALADAALEAVAQRLEPGLSELEVAWELESFLREHGSERLPFDIIVASGPNAALPHARASERALGSGEPIIIDLGAQVAGYASDLSRTFLLGEPDDTYARVYDLVLGAQLAAIAALRPGMTGGEVDALARGIIEEGGYGEAFGHGLGHGLGLNVHELPSLSKGSSTPVTEGTVFTVEPGIYLPGWGGVRIEDVVLLHDGQAQVLTHTRKVWTG